VFRNKVGSVVNDELVKNAIPHEERRRGALLPYLSVEPVGE